MWNSPDKLTEGGTQYAWKELTALSAPLLELWENRCSVPVRDLVGEAILGRLDPDELSYVIYQVLEALLEPVPIPEKGHTGIQEAIVAELLNQIEADVCREVADPGCGFMARFAVWNSVDHLLVRKNPHFSGALEVLEEFGVNPSDPFAYRSSRLTPDRWESLVGLLQSEFLWDEDWRMDSLMDLAPEQSEAMAALIGLDLETVQSLSHTPSKGELEVAERYVSGLLARTNEFLEAERSVWNE